MPQKAISFSSFANIINGTRYSSALQTTGLDPSTGLPLWDVPVARKADLDEAVQAAKVAFPEWSQRRWKERQSLLGRLREALLEYRDEMVELLMKEAGKPVRIPMSNYGTN
jgi:acyl-CoA reductase-like NAD-dependent aldehyde dehydrogenase